MKHKFFYGIKPNINSYSPKDFSQKDYECSLLFQTKRGAPVVVARHKSLDIWKVQNGFSSVFFGTKAEALAYCRGCFLDADGKAVQISVPFHLCNKRGASCTKSRIQSGNIP